jgi:hypothetical protein
MIMNRGEWLRSRTSKRKGRFIDVDTVVDMDEFKNCYFNLLLLAAKYRRRIF